MKFMHNDTSTDSTPGDRKPVPVYSNICGERLQLLPGIGIGYFSFTGQRVPTVHRRKQHQQPCPDIGEVGGDRRSMIAQSGNMGTCLSVVQIGILTKGKTAVENDITTLDSMGFG